MKKILLNLIMFLAIATSALAQRHTDQLDRGLVAVQTGVAGNSSSNLLTWRRLTNEYFGVTYNVYKDSIKVASNLTTTSYSDPKSATYNTQYQVAAVIGGIEQKKCAAIKPWKQYVYQLNVRCATGYLDIALDSVYSRSGINITDHYQPNDAEMADLDGDGQLEIIIKRLNTYDASTAQTGKLYPQESTQFVVLDAYDVDWVTGEATLMWRIDCGPNMVSMNSTEINIIAFDWDEDGKAEVVLRGADNMIVYGTDGRTQLYTIGNMSVNTRNTFDTTDGQYAWTHTGAEYLIYMNGQTGALYQKIDFPLKRLESGESSLNAAWGDDYGHRSSKYFFGAPFLDGRHASLFLGRGIYTRHKMIAMNLDRTTHQWSERWRWNCNDSSSPWYGNGYHNYIIADVDEDGRDEIVYGSMVIDDNGQGLSTTGLRHGDAQHVGDFDPYRKGLEFYGCNEDKPSMNYRNATTSEIYYRVTGTSDDGRGLMDNFTNLYPGSIGRSVSSSIISSVCDKPVEGMEGDSFIAWGDLNFRIYWDGDLCSEILNSPGTAREAKVEKPGTGRLFTSNGCNMNNSSKNNPCFQGDIIGDWREEFVLRCGTNIRVYTTGMGTDYSLPTLWNDHQYRQAMVWQMMAYNQPPHLSYFLGEMEGITQAPPTLTMDGRTEISNGGSITSANTTPVILCETNDMTVSVGNGAHPEVVYVNAPSWVQGHDDNDNITTTYYTHTLTGGAFTGSTRLVKQGDGVLQLPTVTETYTGATDVWAGTLLFDGTLQSSPLWLNRFTTLVSQGGTFGGGITADYASRIIPGGENRLGTITTTTLTLNHGSRLVIDLDVSNTSSDQLNATQLVINTMTGEAWENYGPQYLKPVIEFNAQNASAVPDATYDLGTVEAVSGSLNDLIIEGLDGVSSAALKLDEGHLWLIVGSGTNTTCPTPTFTTTALPVLTINNPSFECRGATVISALTGVFTDAEGLDTDVNLYQTLYAEDYEDRSDASDWTTKYATIGFGTGDANQGNYAIINQGSGSGPRSAYKRLYATGNDIYDHCDSYAVEFDAKLHYTNGNYDPNAIVLYGEGQAMPNSNATFGGSNYLFRVSGGANYGRVYTVDGDAQAFTLTDAAWYHYAIDVDCVNRTVSYVISQDGTEIGNGSYAVGDNVDMRIQGFFVQLGRANSYAYLDNINIYRTDVSSFTFTEPGTLTVTASYPGCKPATAVYTYEGYTLGDVNGNGQVDIGDAVSIVNYLVGKTSEKFVEAAADTNKNGQIDIGDAVTIVNFLVGKTTSLSRTLDDVWGEREPQ